MGRNTNAVYLRVDEQASIFLVMPYTEPLVMLLNIMVSTFFMGEEGT
jgi:hypothetical protein